MTMTREELETKTTPELQTLCRERDLRGARLLHTPKAEMVEFLLNGTMPSTYRNAEPQPSASSIDSAKLQALEILLGGGNARDDRFDKLADIVSRLADKVHELEQQKPTMLEVKVGELPSVKLEGQHARFETVLKLASIRRNVFLYGPAGTGKTSLAKNIAKALSLPCYCQSVCAQSSVIMLSGYQSATGQYIPSTFRNAYENGGVYCLDEIDAGNPNVLTWLNSAIENGECTFPDSVVKRHQDFICFATGNTAGNGATKEFQGRLAQDGALLNRFARVYLGVSPAIEKAMANGNTEWYEYCLSIRKKIDDLGIRHTVTSRAIRDGAMAMKAGVSFEECREFYVTAGLSDSDKKRLGV